MLLPLGGAPYCLLGGPGWSLPVPLVDSFLQPSSSSPTSVPASSGGLPTPLVTRPHQPHLGPDSVTCPQIALSLEDLLGARPASRQTPCWVSL